jgi:hypothetical protein
MENNQNRAETQVVPMENNQNRAETQVVPMENNQNRAETHVVPMENNQNSTETQVVPMENNQNRAQNIFNTTANGNDFEIVFRHIRNLYNTNPELTQACENYNNYMTKDRTAILMERLFRHFDYLKDGISIDTDKLI